MTQQSEAPNPYQVAVEPLDDIAALQARWQALEAKSTPSFFLSWAFIGNWLSVTTAPRHVLSVSYEGEVVALAILGRRGPELFLNQSGQADEDVVFIEYNDILAVPHHGSEARKACLRFVDEMPDAQRLHLAGTQLDEWLAGAPEQWLRITETDRLAHYVELDAVREHDSFLSLLSANTRQQIRRSARLLEYDLEDPGITVAPNAETGLQWLEDMHSWQKSWFGAKEKISALDSPIFHNFLKAMIQNSPRACEMLRIGPSDAPLGYLFNFLHHGQVLNYQSAFRPVEDNRLKPGLVSHAAAIAFYAKKGHDIYHFLAGDAQYKESLGTSCDVLFWGAFARKTIAETARQGVRSLKRALNL